MKAGETLEYNVYTSFSDSDQMPHDWSLVAWAEQEKLEISHADGIKSAQFFNVERDLAIEAPQNYTAATVNPVEPVEPVDPVNPIDPVEPVDPIEPFIPEVDQPIIEIGPLNLNGDFIDVMGESKFFYDVRLSGPDGTGFDEHITQSYYDYTGTTDFTQTFKVFNGTDSFDT